MRSFGRQEEIEDFQALIKAGEPGPLHKCIENWSRGDRAEIAAAKAAAAVGPEDVDVST